MKFKQLIFLFLIFSLSHLHAQAPGYLGKRFMLKADLGLTPSLIGPTAANKGLSIVYGNAKTAFALSYRMGVEASYVVSRKTSIGFEANYFKTGATSTAYTRSTAILSGPSNVDNHSLFYNLTSVTTDVSIKSFKLSKGSIAPLGTYFAYHLSRSFISGEILDRKTEYSRQTTTIRSIDINKNYAFSSFGLEWGVNTMLTDHVLFDFSSRFNFPLNIVKVFERAEINAPTFPLSDYPAYNQKQFDNMSFRRIATHSLFLVHIGVGYLLF